MHIWTDETPRRGDAGRARPRGGIGPGVVRRHLELLRLADRPGRHLAARRPGRTPLASTQVEYSLLNRAVEHEVLPAAAALGLGVLPWSPLGRGVLTGKYRTGTPVGLARRVAASSSTFVGAYLDERRAAASSRRSPAPPTGWAGPRSRSRWPGCATGPASPRPIVGARTAAQLQGALGVEELTLPAEIVEALDDVSGD